jgi:hypothetical protein
VYSTNNMRSAAATAMASKVTHIAAHTDYPGLTGTNEVGSRAAVSWNAASSGTVGQSGTTNISVAGSTTAKWVGLWDASSGGNFSGAFPVGGAAKEYIADPPTNVFTSPSHGFADTNVIVFVNGVPPAGLTAGTEYFARDCTTDTFKVAATSGGVAIDITDRGDGACIVSKLVAEIFSNPGTLAISGMTLNPAAF